MDESALEGATAISEDAGLKCVLMAGVSFREMRIAELISSEFSAD